jgi:hypothetical protein
VLTTLAAGCGNAAPGPLLSSAGGGSVASASCPVSAGGGIPFAGPPPTSTPLVPLSGFRVSWVLRCTTKIENLPGRGQWTMQVTSRADTSAQALLTQLQQPSDPPATTYCPDNLVLLPYFVLVGVDDRAIAPTVPHGPCGQPKAAVAQALEALPFRTISVTPMRQLQSQPAIDSGCSSSFKDMLAITPPRNTSGPVRLPWPAPVTTLHVCIYSHISGGAIPVGQFDSGAVLTGTGLTKVLTALTGATPAAPCTTPHSRYAVLTDPHSGWAIVELDGCRRFVLANGTIEGQLDPAAVRTLLPA